ncbi:L-lactate dehydrogenase [Companilactobacillus sp.]|jgi:malate/lactate dehydrogenase|uniref:L-lactate dehydrogenase n=1 Tax=Companilactobacillus sp. TaxID=2767905 RepID=UPI0025B8E62D|nr:L-lactate dehydrogenase [Companilactobacillus sp.]MCH4008276.1 L-lactate dehydrogenase [Companilactobacillus sp.]MCH4051545.1 L-lactate dehydrogenase [Companilactobacillus sp.]MCH4076219.1 L-lactate dehydrogenase [Companilactobacillus sp.]MCH4124794.1 L-lactate dehydrogenase [Companilactobacillus sp.]MCH4131336.1 L-lactate dehydrogenase [Companilactobacillus sp.]
MSKVAIIGLGHVGSTTAYTLVSRDLIDELVLFDKHEKIVTAQYKDLKDGQVGLNSHVDIIRPDLSELKDTDIIIFSAGKIAVQQGSGNRFDELNYTKKVAEEWGPKIKESGFNGILINITNPCDVIARHLQELSGLPKNHVFGTGTSLDTARMKQAVSDKLGVHANSVHGHVFGEHGMTQFVPWTKVRIENTILSDKLTQEEQDDLENQAKQNGVDIFFGKGFTCYGIANQAALIVQTVLSDSKKVMPVSVFNEQEGIYIGEPAMIGADGIEKIYPLDFTDKEQAKWDASVASIKEMYAAI